MNCDRPSRLDLAISLILVVMLRASLVVVVIASIAGLARADGDAAEVLFDEGRKLLAAGKPDDACAKFEESLVRERELEPFGTMLNLGLCNEQRDRLATAIRWFRKAQTRASETGHADYEAAAKQKTADLQARVPTVKLGLTHALPAGAFVAIDGVRVESIDLSRVELDAGRHVIELRGATIPAQTIELGDGDHRVVTVLVPVPELPTRIETVVIDPGRGRKRGAIALGIAGIAMLGGDIAVGVIGRQHFDAEQHPGDRSRWQNIVRYGGTSMFLVGAGAVVAAVYLYKTAPPKRRYERTIIVPAIGPDGASAIVQGAW
jgi:hypothetical protein